MSYFKKSVIFAVSLIILLTIIWYFDLSKLLNIEKVQEIVEAQGQLAPLMYLLIYIILIVLFFPVTPIAIIASTIFGVFKGALLILLGTTIGATISFLLIRYFGKDIFQHFFKKKIEKADKYNKLIENNAFVTVFAMRLIPFFPFKGPNIILAVSQIKIKPYIFGTLLGSIPESLVFAFVGTSILSPTKNQIILTIILILLLMSIGYFAKRHFLDKALT